MPARLPSNSETLQAAFNYINQSTTAPGTYTVYIQGDITATAKITQTEGKDAEEFDIALTMEQANLMLDVLKLMPFYLVHDLIMEIVEQGRAEIGKVEAKTKAEAEAEDKTE